MKCSLYVNNNYIHGEDTDSQVVSENFQAMVAQEYTSLYDYYFIIRHPSLCAGGNI
jgi:hypothetical protein